MGVERQPGGLYQRLLFEEPTESPRPGEGGEGGTQPASREESQASAASDPGRALTERVMEEVTSRDNLNRAYRRVMANKGAPGVDGMTLRELAAWIARHKEKLIASLLDGSYEPQPVRGVEIPKPGGGVRQLGIPTVVDRLVQQAILQVLEPILDPTFSASSFGFRPGRGAHDALAQASRYVAEGRTIVVDLDLEKFFDRVNHDLLMARLAARVADKRLLKIVRRFLRAGLLRQGVCVERHEGTPQGGPLSPLLANLLLDDLDRELEQRGHCFCRYADDCNIYVRSQAAGERVMQSLIAFLEGGLKLRVNREKSAVAPVWERKFLGHRLLADGGLGIAPKSLERAKDRIRELTSRNRGVSFEELVGRLNSFLAGWVTYFRHARCKTALAELEEWIRRRLRCFRLKQRKRKYALAQFLMELGVPEWRAWILASSGKGWWRKAGSPPAQEAMSRSWFTSQGLISLTQRYAQLQTSSKPPDTQSTSGGVGGRGR
jgi:RNA-directed DNA polymerase